ncbi:hypothetical protein VCRA2126O85_30239 [Vibrio crassostreae]|nr:hypothetical protein VCRA2127O91_30016 [Vibrio crassostreae]CAK2943852.1 hypothetical protein VCRA2126O85_30239 [Vibrio crassostreae]CAK3447636.1 hypothetical protein VCRA2128O105_30016 [Vibrio crassostreae]CAK3514022.1 hypothetical protein VCRA2126O87_30016 [Vibrio crassostreae]
MYTYFFESNKETTSKIQQIQIKINNLIKSKTTSMKTNFTVIK